MSCNNININTLTTADLDYPAIRGRMHLIKIKSWARMKGFSYSLVFRILRNEYRSTDTFRRVCQSLHDDGFLVVINKNDKPE